MLIICEHRFICLHKFSASTQVCTSGEEEEACMQLLGCNIGRLKYLCFFKYWSLTLLTHSLTRMFLISYELLK